MYLFWVLQRLHEKAWRCVVTTTMWPYEGLGTNYDDRAGLCWLVGGDKSLRGVTAHNTCKRWCLRNNPEAEIAGFGGGVGSFGASAL